MARPFDAYKARPMQRFTSSLWNSVMEELNRLYMNATRGSQDYPFDVLYAGSGYFDTLLVQGRHVIKDGDPVNIYDIFEPAKAAITSAVDQSSRLASIEEYTRTASGQLVKLRIDEYGNIGVIIAEPVDTLNRVRVSLEDAFAPVYARGSIAAADNTAGLEVELDTGGRPYVSIYYSVGGAASVEVYFSEDGSAWRLRETITLALAGSGFKDYPGTPWRYVRVRVPTTGVDAELVVTASR